MNNTRPSPLTAWKQENVFNKSTTAVTLGVNIESLHSVHVCPMVSKWSPSFCQSLSHKIPTGQINYPEPYTHQYRCV